jgi:hypothetical protein
MKKLFRTNISLISLLFPVLASAQIPAPKDFKEFAELILNAIGYLTGILIAAGLLGLMWGVVVFFASADNPQKREAIKPYLFWGIIGVTVMMGVWGFVELLASSVFGGGFNIGIPFISAP